MSTPWHLADDRSVPLQRCFSVAFGSSRFLLKDLGYKVACFLFGVGVGFCHFISHVSAFVLDVLGLDLS